MPIKQLKLSELIPRGYSVFLKEKAKWQLVLNFYGFSFLQRVFFLQFPKQVRQNLFINTVYLTEKIF